MIGLNDSRGARIQEGVEGLIRYGKIFCSYNAYELLTACKGISYMELRGRYNE
jgi:acetyl-CoA carboxylase carboxyltransferase component